MSTQWDGEGMPPIDPEVSQRIGEYMAAAIERLLTVDDVREMEGR